MPEPTEAELKALEPEIQAARDENDSLRQECQELRAELKQHKGWIDEVTGLLPPSYDGDEAPEALIIHFLEDMQKVSQVIAKLTADYR
jgi:predicted  nucleic acid-binding Zn-ribbon protein